MFRFPPVIFADNQSTSRIRAVISDQNNNSGARRRSGEFLNLVVV